LWGLFFANARSGQFLHGIWRREHRFDLSKLGWQKKEGFREQLIHRAEADGIDLIIVGRRGRSMISWMMLGSVSERALRYAHCPVMVVH
jgi:hypothetical protein